MKILLLRPALGLCLGLLLLFASCKKDSDPAPVGPPFVGKTYRMASFTLNPPFDFDEDGKPDSDLLKLMKTCELDNTISFGTGGKITVDFATLTCSDDDPADRNGGTWTYNETSKVLSVTDKDDPTEITDWEVAENGTTIQATTRFEEGGIKFQAVMVWKSI